MKRLPTLLENGPTLLLRLVVLALAAVVLGLCIFALPAGIGSAHWGGYRVIFAGMYVPAIPFFYALYQAMKLLSYIDHNNAFSAEAVQALRRVKYAAIAIGVLYAVGMPYIYYVADQDDAPGVVAIGLVIVFASWVIATAAAVFQRLFQNAVEMKAENDLTV